MGLEIEGRDIVVRSTVPVGTCKSLGVSFMPEFLTEANWEEDFKSVSTRVIGMPNPKDQALSGKFLNLFYAAETHKKINESRYLFCSTREAETAKLARNSFLAVKVSFFNEIYSFCEKLDIDYATVADMIAADERIGISHTQVPGPDGKKGFGGTCFPKDINSFIYQMNKEQLIASVMGGAKYRNENLDRSERDWEDDKGRAIL
jgi:UDPglucose 6-dehydrogenase